jgi:hypothetical protein
VDSSQPPLKVGGASRLTSDSKPPANYPQPEVRPPERPGQRKLNQK